MEKLRPPQQQQLPAEPVAADGDVGVYGHACARAYGHDIQVICQPSVSEPKKYETFFTSQF